MASAYEIRQVAVKVKKISADIDLRRASAYTSAQEASLWWVGDSSSAFAHEYNKINNDIHALLDIFAQLETQLKIVSDELEKQGL